MLTGSGGYLTPDYLKPLPTTLDAKNSPLALLAKTCSNIGKDESAKSIIPPLEKRDVTKLRESPVNGAAIGLGGVRTSSAGEAHSISNRDSVGTNTRGKTTPERATMDKYKMELKDMHSPRTTVLSPRKDVSSPKSSTPKSSPGLSHTSSGHNKLDIKGSSDSNISLKCGTLSLEINHKENTGTSINAHSTSGSPPSTSVFGSNYAASILSSLAPHAGLLSAYYPHLGFGGYQGLHPGFSAEALLAAVASQQRHNDSSGTPHVAVTYNPVKTASGATTLVPVCADPFCASCKLAMHTAQLAPSPPGGASGSVACSAGCTQCSREKTLSSVLSPPTSLAGSYAGLGLSGLHGLSSLYGSHHHHHHQNHHNTGNHSSGSSSALPYVCSWVSGSSYCGEKYATSEELMSHLRTHTVSLEQSALHSAGLAAAAAYNPLALAGLGGLYSPLGGSSASVSLSPSGLGASGASAGGRHYPRSLSPTSLLATRYHPYFKPPPHVLSALGASSISSPAGLHPSLAAAYSGLYPSLGRYGAALVP